MSGVVPSGFSERELMCDPVEGVATVANPVRPGDQVLPASSRTHLLEAEPAYDISTLDREAAQRSAHLGDNCAMGTGDDLVLFATRREPHKLALYP
jgi:hypothetical protein